MAFGVWCSDMLPIAYLDGHAWHTYSLESEDKTVQFTFIRRVNGRDVYADALYSLLGSYQRKLKEIKKERFFQ